MVVGDMPARNANKFPAKIAIVSEDVVLTFKALNERVNCLANALTKKGLHKGDRIGVLVHNCHQFVEIYFAAAKAGGIFCPYNNHLKKSELKDIMDYSTPKILFVDSDYGDLVESLRPELDSVDCYICLQKSKWPSMESYEEVLSDSNGKEPGIHIQEDDPMSMFFTAGTTGKPKGALRTHRHLIMNAITGVIELKVDYEERALIAFPMYHVSCEDNIGRHSFMPNTMFIRREGGFNPADVLSFIEKERITRCQMVPTMIHALLQIPDVERFDLSSLRLIMYAGAPMPVELLKKALQVFPCGFAQMYGQTESGPMTTVLGPEDHVPEGSEKRLQRLASAGKPVVSYEIRIVRENGEDVSIGEVGEIIGRSEAMMKGYWQQPEETAKKLKNGWLYTGDLGRFDEDGYIYIVERKNDMIISGGVNIYPREIEEVLYKHPAVSEASVIGVPDEHWGEVAKAIIVLKEGGSASEEEIIKFCGEHLASYKKPKSVEFWKELPKSPQGKILKKVIRESYKKAT
jgi:acyl-CoA synthetase (AMP-forming)/AMP-acid ligase II